MKTAKKAKNAEMEWLLFVFFAFFAVKYMPAGKTFMDRSTEARRRPKAREAEGLLDWILSVPLCLCG